MIKKYIVYYNGDIVTVLTFRESLFKYISINYPGYKCTEYLMNKKLDECGTFRFKKLKICEVFVNFKCSMCRVPILNIKHKLKHQNSKLHKLYLKLSRCTNKKECLNIKKEILKIKLKRLSLQVSFE